MSNDDHVYFEEETDPVVPGGLDLLLYEPGDPASENLVSRGRFLAGAAAGVGLLAGAGALARPGAAAPSRSLAAPVKGLARQGILVWDTGSEPAQLNPIGPANDPPVRFPTLWNSSSLFRFTNSKEGVVFDLARAFKASRDGSTWDIFLRPGVTWHDGTPFTAADVVASYNAVATPSYGSAWLGFFPQFREAEAINPLTVRMHMRRPATWWIYTMAALPVAKASDVQNRDLMARKPVGTGPFMLQEWRTGDRMIFAPNPRYHGSKANGFKRGLPKVKGLQYVTVPDANTRIINLRNGVTALTAEVSPSALGDLQKRGIKIYSAGNTPNRVIYYHPMPANYRFAPAPAGSKPRPEWADINNRKALAYALDRTQIARVAFGGKATPATCCLAPGSLFYNPKLGGYGPRADVARARDFLARASVKINRTLELVVRGTGAGPALDAAQLMQANWKAIGVDVEIQAVDGATQTLRGRQQDFDMNMFSSVTGPSAGRSPNSWLVKLIPNTASSGLRDAPEDLQDLVNTISGSLDRAKVQAAMTRLQQIEIDLCCTVGVVYPDYFEAQGVPLSDYGVLNLGYLPYRVEEARIG